MFKWIFSLFLITGVAYGVDYVIPKIEFREDDAITRVAPAMDPKSHIKVFFPNIPYYYVTKCTNSGLIRSSDNAQGWEYDLAESHKRLDDYTYEFTLRKNLKFQDGTDFDTDSVIENFDYFKKSPILYTNIDKIDFDIVKIDKYRFKIRLKQKYEMFFSDLASIYFYSKKYLKIYGFQGGETGSATRAPGPYGMGPYILAKGFALGDKQTPMLELEANPFYWDSNYPKIKKVTIFTQLDTNEALKMITQKEGELDIMPIPFNKKIEVITSKYTKLITKKSTDNIIIFFNLINGNQHLKNKELRIALNQALNQNNLLSFVYKNEGTLSPFSASANFQIVQKVIKDNYIPEKKLSKEKIKKLLNGLHLNVFTQDQFMFLWKGIEYQLMQYGVILHYTITNSEKDIYRQLLATNRSANTKAWDLLAWGNDDWQYDNPWTVFFIYEYGSAWSTIGKDEVMSENIRTFFETPLGSEAYEAVVAKILYRARDMAYTLKVPSPNKVIAANKEVIYEPYKGAIMPLWKIQITKDHWLLRGQKPYPPELHLPIKPQRNNHEIY